MKKLPLIEDIHKSYRYNKDTGEFIRARNLPKGCVGEKVKCYNAKDYCYLYLNGNRYSAHRIAWKIENGDPGDMQIDHINHIRNDNRLCNLRLVTPSENQKNRSLSKWSKTGFNGVLWRDSAKRMKANEKYGLHKNHGVL